MLAARGECRGYIASSCTEAHHVVVSAWGKGSDVCSCSLCWLSIQIGRGGHLYRCPVRPSQFRRLPFGPSQFRRLPVGPSQFRRPAPCCAPFGSLRFASVTPDLGVRAIMRNHAEHSHEAPAPLVLATVPAAILCRRHALVAYSIKDITPHVYTHHNMLSHN